MADKHQLKAWHEYGIDENSDAYIVKQYLEI